MFDKKLKIGLEVWNGEISKGWLLLGGLNVG